MPIRPSCGGKHTRSKTGPCGRCYRKIYNAPPMSSRARTNRSWRAMLDRCSNRSYPRYGGRGITVCDRWQSSFDNFISDMGHIPPGLTIERINNNGNYEPGNCRWATRKEQNNNRRDTVFIEHNGERLNISQWAHKLQMSKETLVARIRRGWNKEVALTTIPNEGGSSKATGRLRRLREAELERP
jgi:hypothetical protein